MAKAPRHINGVPLIRNGVPAIGDDCCCTPSCYPNACLIDTRALCCQYYCPEADECRHINSFEVNISGVGGAITCPSSGGTDCCYAFDCECDLFNTTFIHELDSVCGGSGAGTWNGCVNLWQLRSPSYNGTGPSDGCNIPPTFACGPWISERTVYIETGFANYQQAYTAGFVTVLSLPNAFTTFGSWQICNDYTLVPGHYIVVIMGHSVILPFSAGGWSTQKMYLYPFANGIRDYEECGDSNYYPAGNFIGGDAVLFASRRFRINGPTTPLTYTWDCNDWDYTCQLADATVTVEPPDYDLCEVEPPPPPPP